MADLKLFLPITAKKIACFDFSLSLSGFKSVDVKNANYATNVIASWQNCQ